MTMTLVSTVEVGAGGAASIDFTSIPQTATDLLVVISGKDTGGNLNAFLRFNSDTASNYKWLRLRGNGATASSGSSASATYVNIVGLPDATSTFGSIAAYIPNYTASTAKSVSAEGVTEANATTAYADLVAGSWSGTAAITSVNLVTQGGTWSQYSTASLYTITKGSGGATVS